MQHHNGFEAEESIPAMADDAWDEADDNLEEEWLDAADDEAEEFEAATEDQADDEFATDEADDAWNEADFAADTGVDDDALAAGETWDDADAVEDAGEAWDEAGDELNLGSIWRAGSSIASRYNRLPPWARRAPGQIFSMLTNQPQDIGNIWADRTETAGNDLQVLVEQLKRQYGDGFDEMDVFADAMAEFAEAGEDWEGFVPPLGKLAARYVVKTAVPKRLQAVRKQAAKSIGKATVRAVEKSTRALVKRFGPNVANAVPRIVRRVVKAVVAQRASPKTIPSMIRRTAVRVAQSPAAARKLARPNKLARSVRSRAGVKPGAAGARTSSKVTGYASSPLKPYRSRRWRTVRIHGPATLRFRV
jgi:hypothetical protein